MVDENIVDQKTSKPKKSIIPYYFVAFFLVVFSANGIMIYTALSSWTGLETKNHYIKGLSYNDNLDGAAAMKALGWEKSLEIVPITNMMGKIVIRIQDKSGDALTNANVMVTAIRPTHHGYDQTVSLQEVSSGQYEAPLEFPLFGQWDLRQEIRHNGKSFQQVDRILIDDKGFH